MIDAILPLYFRVSETPGMLSYKEKANGAFAMNMVENNGDFDALAMKYAENVALEVCCTTTVKLTGAAFESKLNTRLP